MVKTISDALESKNFCSGVFLDVAQAFDRVWIEGLNFKLRCMLPDEYCVLINSYLTDRKFQVSHANALSNWEDIKAGVPQGSVLGPLLYSIYVGDIPVNEDAVIAMYADDTAVLTVSKNHLSSLENLQEHVDKIVKWTSRWKIKINGEKSAHVNFALRKTVADRIFINREAVPQAGNVKYLGLHLDTSLSWSTHITSKCKIVKEKLRSLYWLLNPKSPLSLNNKRLLYTAIVKPV